MRHERDDASVVAETVLLAVSFVVQGDRDAAVQERKLTQPLGEDIEAEDDGFEDLDVRLERHLGAATLRRAGNFEAPGRIAVLVTLLVDLVVAPDFEVERLGQGVHDGHADAVQAAGDFVTVVVELAAGVQHRQHDLGRRSAPLS